MARALDLDELVEHWTLLDDERELIAGKRGPTRLGFRLSFLGHARINFLGRYAITTSAPAQRLRPLGEVPDLPAIAS
jgi:hypothetical protein